MVSPTSMVSPTLMVSPGVVNHPAPTLCGHCTYNVARCKKTSAMHVRLNVYCDQQMLRNIDNGVQCVGLGVFVCIFLTLSLVCVYVCMFFSHSGVCVCMYVYMFVSHSGVCLYVYKFFMYSDFIEKASVHLACKDLRNKLVLFKVNNSVKSIKRNYHLILFVRFTKKKL